MTFDVVGVVGAGVMGSGLAHDLSQHGANVVLVDRNDDRLAMAEKAIRQSVSMQALFKKGAGQPGADEILGKIDFVTEIDRLAEADFVIENVTERWEVKEPVYRALDSVCPEQCVLAANTSAISITQIASATHRPERVIGMHFMNPVPLKPVVEVIPGYHTSDDTTAQARALLTLLGKEGIVVGDMPGFVSNRVLMLTINESVFLVQDQVSNPTDIDRLFKTCFGHAMGPLATADLIGLDTILQSLEVLYESFNDDKFRPCPLLKKMVYAGLLGRKSGQGFHDYRPGL